MTHVEENSPWAYQEAWAAFGLAVASSFVDISAKKREIPPNHTSMDG